MFYFLPGSILPGLGQYVAIYTFSFLIAMPTSEKLASGVND
jgi:hypothetical protein